MNAQLLASEFANILRAWLTPAEFVEMQEKNAANIRSNICASHDYCDANEAMLLAWEIVHGREFEFLSDADGREMDEAWNIAKREYLTAPN